MAVTADEFKSAMSTWTSGVTIVTARNGDEVHGMTVSDFAGVSMDPPLVLVCASKDSNTLQFIQEGMCFAVNVLASDQQELSNRFASKKTENTRFDGLDCPVAKTGAPLIPGARTSFDCTVWKLHDAGDHVVAIGQVEEIRQNEAEPLVYYSGAYRELA